MPTQSEAFRLMLAAISAMREAGYTQARIHRRDSVALVGSGMRGSGKRLQSLDP